MAVSSPMYQESIVTISVNHVDTATLQADIDAIWSKIAQDRDRLGNAQELYATATPYEAQQDARAGVVEAIVIAFVGSLAKEAATKLWNDVVWPALKRKYGADIEKA